MTRGVKDATRAARAALIVRSVLRRAKRKGWDESKTATVILTSLSPNRVKAGIVGPCFYCGDDFAATVDHMQPVSAGGTDDRANLLSCCWDCNALKLDFAFDTFLWKHPFGSDAARERAYFDGLRQAGLERAAKRGPLIQEYGELRVLAAYEPEPMESPKPEHVRAMEAMQEAIARGVPPLASDIAG